MSLRMVLIVDVSHGGSQMKKTLQGAGAATGSVHLTPAQVH
jgi:hypothetical protein